MRSGRRANLARNSGSLQAKFANSTGRQAVQARFSGALASSCGGRSSSVSEAATTTQREGSCQGHGLFEHVGEPNFDQPKGKQDKRRKSECQQDRRSPHPHGHDLLLSQEKGSRRDK